MFDGAHAHLGNNANTHKIFTKLLGMTPKAYIEKRKMDSGLGPPPPPPATVDSISVSSHGLS
jgi:hypothetical protein